MSSKYSISNRRRWERDHVRIADHILGGSEEDCPRWDARTPSSSVAPETAFECGIDLDSEVMPWLAADDERPPDRARLYADRENGERYVVVFLVYENRGEPTAVTVLRPRMLSDPAHRAYLHARADEVMSDA